MASVTANPPSSSHASRVVLVSIAAAILTMLLKFGAYLLTHSVSLLSDAAESSVNLVAALVAFGALTLVARPADEEYRYGYDTAEYFSSGIEGALILVAALTIIYTAVNRFLHPAELEGIGPGLAVALVASAINFGVSRFMLHKAEEFDSITLEADAHHLMTDVWTSVGVVAALAVVMFVPKWSILDPIIAVAVGLNIIRTGVNLVKRSFAGLMDISLPRDEMDQIEQLLREREGPDVVYHKFRTRRSASRRYIELHLLLPSDLTVKAAHDRCTAIEKEIRSRWPKTRITIHVEPKETGGV